jgi:hypothetical protein
MGGMNEEDLQAIESHCGSPIASEEAVLKACDEMMRRHRAAVEYRDIHIRQLIAEVRRLRGTIQPGGA